MVFSQEVEKFRGEVAMAYRCIAGPHDVNDTSMEQLRSSFWAAVISLAVVILLACVVLWWAGKINPGLSADAGKWCAIAGAYFAGLGTWLGLLYGAANASWKGKANHEIASAGFFKLFFLVGVFLSTIGAAWWG